MKKRIAILGSTGSIGTQALDVIEKNPDKFEVEVLTANNNTDLLIAQAKKHKPNVVVIANEEKYTEVSKALGGEFVKVYAGAEAIAQVVAMDTVDLVLTAMVGYAGLLPTIRAVEAGKNIALANKETLVVAGEIITRLALENKVEIYPVDSEHSAIFQCLTGEFFNPIEKIYLTASGGPFLGYSQEQLKKVTPQDALRHPNWDMGAKITIDSATMMNKGFEVIEAKWLFDLKPEQIDVIVHSQSIIHSIVQFQDGSMKAQMGLPDMRVPIQYAMGFPERLVSDFPRFNFLDYPALTFEHPDTKNFRNLALAFEVMEKAGNAPCVLNAANEIAVKAFLDKKIGFLQISELIDKTIETASFVQHPTLDDYIQSNEEARRITESFLN